MEFDITVKVTRQDVPVSAHFDGRCLQCKSTDTKIRSSYTREVVDLGTPIEQRIARVTMATIECNACGCTFTPVPREYPLKYEYSLAVIMYAMVRYYHENASANTIQKGLKMLHNVDVPVDTIYTWIKRLSDDYAKTMRPKGDAPLASNAEVPVMQEPKQEDGVKTIAVDGTFVTTGVDVIGKKKPVVLLSLTRRPDGTLLPTSKKPKTKKT
jgi:transposase-like protein